MGTAPDAGREEDPPIREPGRPPFAPRSLKRNFLWTLGGNLFFAACQWGILVVMAKLGTPEVVGRFALGLAICAPVFLLANLELRSIQATDARAEYAFSDYAAVRVVTTLVALAGIAAIVGVVGYPAETAAVILLVGGLKALESASDLYYGSFQQDERMDRIAVSMGLSGGLYLAGCAAGLTLGGGAVGATLGILVARGVVVLAHDRPRHAVGRGEAQAAGSRLRLARLALPLGAAGMLTTLHAALPQYFVERLLGERELGFFAAMAYFIVGGAAVANALGQSASSRLARHYALGDRRAFSILTLKMVSVCVALGGAALGVAAFGGEALLAALYTPEYARYATVFVWLMTATLAAFVSGCLTYGVVAARFFWIQVPCNAAVLGLTAAACGLLIPRFGLLGAAWATGLAYAGQAAWKVAVTVWAVRAGAPRSPLAAEPSPPRASGPAR